MTKNTLFNRRFIRLQAVMHFYAFHVAKKANYDWALGQIRDAFVPDVFTELPIAHAQLAQETQQALTLFSSSLLPTSASFDDMAPPNSRISAVVSRALANYQSELARDVHKLEKGLTEAVVKINRACLCIWQLLVVWARIARKQTEKPKLNQRRATVSSVCLSLSPMLQRLQSDDALAQLVQHRSASWEEHVPMVENWYNQFVKKDPTVQCCLVHPITPAQDQQLLMLLIEDIIFSRGEIQSFFYDLDLQWATHKRMVKKLVRQGLTQLAQNSRKSPSLVVHEVSTHSESGQIFYADLVRKTLENDKTLEGLIVETAKNWSVERIVLLDKTIIKLALCEMMYLTNIPINVSINEYIDLSKVYGTPKSSQFVSGLLGTIAATLQ